MLPFRAVFEVVDGRALTDVLVAGYTDHDGSIPRFHPLFDDVYLDFAGQLVRASSVGQFWALELALVDRIEPRFTLEEGDVFAVSSIAFVLERPEGTNRLLELRAFVEDDEARSESPPCCGAAFVFTAEDGTGPQDVLFLDPRNPFGIHVRGRDGLDAWKADRRVRECLLRGGAR